jgi:hypothetical protein
MALVLLQSLRFITIIIIIENTISKEFPNLHSAVGGTVDCWLEVKYREAERRI